MKKKNLVLFALLLVAAFFLNSCASTTQGKATSIEQAHPDRLKKTVVGMSVSEFKSIWPEATKSGMSENKETYVFIYDHILLYAPDYKIHTYFYFVDGKLVGYDSEQKSLL